MSTDVRPRPSPRRRFRHDSRQSDPRWCASGSSRRAESGRRAGDATVPSRCGKCGPLRTTALVPDVRSVGPGRGHVEVEQRRASDGVGQPLGCERSWRPTTCRGSTPSPQFDCSRSLLAPKNTEINRRRSYPRSFVAEEIWCQLFSDRGAGSDLASLATRGAATVTSGSSRARRSGRRGPTRLTSRCSSRAPIPHGPKPQDHLLTFIDMRQDAVSPRPHAHMGGETEFFQVFLDGAGLPDSQRVGAVGDGWRVAQATLGGERQMVAAPAPAGRPGRVAQRDLPGPPRAAARSRRGSPPGGGTRACGPWSSSSGARSGSVNSRIQRVREPAPRRAPPGRHGSTGGMLSHALIRELTDPLLAPELDDRVRYARVPHRWAAPPRPGGARGGPGGSRCRHRPVDPPSGARDHLSFTAERRLSGSPAVTDRPDALTVRQPYSVEEHLEELVRHHVWQGSRRDRVCRMSMRQ